jgi:nucleotide-binding universal stress UspA family protein
MIKKILVAYDGSPPAEKAFDFGLDLAVKYSAALTVLSISRPPEIPDDVETEALLESAMEHYEMLFAKLRERAVARNMQATFEIRVGHPADQIIHFANEDDTDMIVLGHRGKSMVARWLMGSISRRVVSYAACSVLIVR